MNAKMKEAPQSGKLAENIARKVQFTFERELDTNKAGQEVAKLVYEAFSTPDKLPFFVSFLRILLEDPETVVHVPSTLSALSWADTPKKEYFNFLEDSYERSARGHSKKDLPDYTYVESGKTFSYYAYVFGETFIQIYKDNKDNYEIVGDGFSSLIRTEMDWEQERLEQKFKDQYKRKKEIEETPVNAKKLYDDIFDYITERGIFRSETLMQVNPLEFIADLADKMRSTRRYCMQDVMNKKALHKKKELEKQLKEREASAEEIMATFAPLKAGLSLFHEAKLYNTRYMDTEKRRVTMQILPVLVATTILAAGFMELMEISLGSYVILGLMILLPKFLFTKALMSKFYPVDQTSELEVELTNLMGVFKKCSHMQLTSLLNRVIKEMTNVTMMNHLPDFIIYCFTVMPDRKSALMKKEDLDDVMVNLRRTVSFRQRQLQMLAQ
ncbi:MAG: hypothetical protein QNL04_03990 [SAR324 cluster bacterium]|nr:hypothetical protein [SAR324 cluster bacterium]